MHTNTDLHEDRANYPVMCGVSLKEATAADTVMWHHEPTDGQGSKEQGELNYLKSIEVVTEAYKRFTHPGSRDCYTPHFLPNNHNHLIKKCAPATIQMLTKYASGW